MPISSHSVQKGQRKTSINFSTRKIGICLPYWNLLDTWSINISGERWPWTLKVFLRAKADCAYSGMHGCTGGFG